MGAEEAARRPHAAAEVQGRLLKARKIEIILGEDCLDAASSLLDVGTGAGITAWHFSQRGAGRLQVSAVDALDSRVIKEGYEFRQVVGVQLPYADRSFDIVVFNHVIEHVGGPGEQIAYLREIYRVLRPQGTVYFAAPNRWSLIEPHYRIPFLSWLPRRWASALVKHWGRGPDYDCTPLGAAGYRRLFRDAGFTYQDRAWEALAAMIRLETSAGGKVSSVIERLPGFVGAMFGWISPTQIYLLGKRAQ